MEKRDRVMEDWEPKQHLKIHERAIDTLESQYLEFKDGMKEMQKKIDVIDKELHTHKIFLTGMDGSNGLRSEVKKIDKDLEETNKTLNTMSNKLYWIMGVGFGIVAILELYSFVK